MAGGSTAGKYRVIGTYMSLQTHKGSQTRGDHSLSRIQRTERSTNIRGLKTYVLLLREDWLMVMDVSENHSTFILTEIQKIEVQDPLKRR